MLSMLIMKGPDGAQLNAAVFLFLPQFEFRYLELQSALNTHMLIPKPILDFYHAFYSTATINYFTSQSKQQFQHRKFKVGSLKWYNNK